MLRRTAPILLLMQLSLCAGLAGCAATKSAGQWLGLLPMNPLREVQLSAAADANGQSATQLDLVWVLDSATLAQLPKSGPQWFSDKPVLLAGRSASLLVLHLEVPVGSAQQAIELPTRHGEAIAVLAYPNYLAAAGQPVATLTSFRCVRIELAAASVHYESCP
ncbi:hypothetical protein ACFJGW_18030 [Burkholderiaceae bacterium UC74_6]